MQFQIDPTFEDTFNPLVRKIINRASAGADLVLIGLSVLLHLAGVGKARLIFEDGSRGVGREHAADRASHPPDTLVQRGIARRDDARQ